MIVLGEARPKGNGTHSDNYSLAKDCNTPALGRMFSLPFLSLLCTCRQKVTEKFGGKAPRVATPQSPNKTYHVQRGGRGGRGEEPGGEE